MIIRKRDIKKGLIIDDYYEDNTVMELLSPQGEIITYIDEDMEELADSNPYVNGKQRWLVCLRSLDPFGNVTERQTHRYVKFRIGEYKKWRLQTTDKGDVEETISRINIGKIPESNFDKVEGNLPKDSFLRFHGREIY